MLRNVSNVTGVRSNVDLGSSVLLLGGPMWLAQVALYAGYVIAGLAVLFSLRRDRELSYVVTVMATLLLAPLLWDHYLTMLIIPAAFVASRGRPWAIFAAAAVLGAAAVGLLDRRAARHRRVHAAVRGADRVATAVPGGVTRRAGGDDPRSDPFPTFSYRELGGQRLEL